MTHLVGVSDRSAFTSSATIYNSTGEWHKQFTASASGTTTTIGVKIADWWTASAMVVFIRDNSGNVLGSATFSSADGTGELTKTLSGVSITASTQYILGARINTGYVKFSNNTVTYQVRSRSWSAAYPTLDDPATLGTTNANGDIAIWVEGSSGPSITDVDTDETVTSTQTGVVHTVTGAGASQGASTLTYEHAASSVVVEQTVTSWSDTSITASVVRTSGGYTLPYGAITAKLTVSGSSGTLAITLTPADARSYVTLTSLATEGNRITAVGLAIGDQLEVTSVTGGSISDVTLNADGTFDYTVGVTSFTVQAWDATDGTLGTAGTQTISSGVEDQGNNQGSMLAAAQSVSGTTDGFNGDLIAWARTIAADTSGNYNELLIKALQSLLSSTETNINNLMALAAADRSVSRWQEIGTNLTTIGS